MSVTVPLSTPVRTITSARAVAEAVALAADGEAVGPALDRLMRFLNVLGHPALVAYSEGIFDILHTLGHDRAQQATEWLTAHAVDLDCACYWAQLNELTYLGYEG